MKRSLRVPTARRWSAAALTVAAAAALSACSGLSPTSVLGAQQLGDGTSTTVTDAAGGTVKVENFVVVVDKQGGTGMVVGAVVNTGPGAVDLELTASSGQNAQSVAPTVVHVEPGALVQVGPSGTTMTVADMPVPPGAMIAMTARTAAGGSSLWSVPVVLPQGPYATYTAAG